METIYLKQYFIQNGGKGSGNFAPGQGRGVGKPGSGGTSSKSSSVESSLRALAKKGDDIREIENIYNIKKKPVSEETRSKLSSMSQTELTEEIFGKEHSDDELGEIKSYVDEEYISLRDRRESPSNMLEGEDWFLYGSMKKSDFKKAFSDGVLEYDGQRITGMTEKEARQYIGTYREATHSYDGKSYDELGIALEQYSKGNFRNGYEDAIVKLQSELKEPNYSTEELGKKLSKAIKDGDDNAKSYWEKQLRRKSYEDKKKNSLRSF